MPGANNRPACWPCPKTSSPLFAHCFTCSKILAAANITKALCRARIIVLRFDFIGLGGSQGAAGWLAFPHPQALS